MKKAYVHGYDQRENIRLQDQASTLVELLHSDTKYPAGSRVLEAGCGVGKAQSAHESSSEERKQGSKSGADGADPAGVCRIDGTAADGAATRHSAHA